MWLSTCHMCFIKAILEHFRARRRLRFGSPDIVWPVQSRTMVSVDQHGVVNFCESYVSWSWRRGQIDNFHNSALPLTFFWLSWEILNAISTEKRDFLQFVFKAIRARRWRRLHAGPSSPSSSNGAEPASTPSLRTSRVGCPARLLRSSAARVHHGLMVTLEIYTSATSTNRRDRCAPAHP